MPARALTDVEVRALKAPDGQRLILYDAKARGLCLRVTSRTKSWSFVYRPRGSPRQRRYTIGDYPAWSLSQARDKALVLRRTVQDGGDPVADSKARAHTLTLAGLIERFIECHAKARLRSWKTYDDLLRRDVVPALGDRPADKLTRAEVGNLLDKIAERAPTVSNRVKNTLSSVMSWAVSEGLVDANPVLGLKPRHEEVAKDRVLSDEEIRAFWDATANIPPGYRDALRLVLLTGQRPGECAGITAEEVDLAAELWTLPPARTKNKSRHAVPLVGEALAMVSRLKAATPEGTLLSKPRGGTPTPQDVAPAFARMCESGLFTTPATPHDLRRTAATLMGRLGIDRMTVGHVLNHSSTTKATITGSVYDRYDYLPQRRRALEALDSELNRLIAPEQSSPSNVVALVGAGR